MNLLVKSIAESGYKYIMTMTGGGAEALARATRNGGASKWLIGAHYPYSELMSRRMAAIAVNIPGIMEAPCVSKEFAVALASSAYMTNPHVAETSDKIISVACTAKLGYEGQREGRENIAYISVLKTNIEKTTFFNYKFVVNSNYPRDIQEDKLATAILSAMSVAPWEEPSNCRYLQLAE
jgi:hypothetical protein